MKNSFLQHTAQAIMKQLSWAQLSQVTLVLPSHRAGLVLKNELLRLQQSQSQQAVWAPTVTTLTRLQDMLSPLYSEDELLTIVRLYRLYRACPGTIDMPLDMFYGWGRQMLSDFTNIDASMPASEVNNFFENTIAAHELSTLQIDPELESRLKSLFRPDPSIPDTSTFVKEQYDQLWRNMHTLYHGLREEMIADQKGYPGMRLRSAIEHWNDESIQSRIAGRIYFFVGFNYLLPAERELMQLFSSTCETRFIWDDVQDFKTNEKAFSFVARNSQILGRLSLPDDHRSFPRPVTVMACASREAQAQYVHRWLQENYTEAGQKVGVVICDETMLESVIYTLPAITLPGKQEPEPINITKGFPLRNTAIFARTINYLYDPARGDADDAVSPDFIEQMLVTLFPLKSDTTDDQSESEMPAPEKLHWQELLILESEFQVRKIANQMRQLIAQGLGDVPFTLKLLRLLFRRVMENVTMPFHGEPITDMQVMGVLETRLMDFDKLLLLNVEEGVLPQTQADTSFIPYYLRKAYSMQTSDERASVYAYNFFRLLTRTADATILFTTTDASADSRGMSRFIMQMLVSPEFNVTKSQLKEQSVVAVMDDSKLETSGVSKLDTLLLEDHRLKNRNGSSYVLTPSAINTYLSCPRKFCFQYIQNRKGVIDEGPLFGSAMIGTLVHNTIQYLYTTYLHAVNGVVVPVSPDQIDYIISHPACVDEALLEAYKTANTTWLKDHPDEPDHYKPEEHKAEKSIILAYVRNILDRDREDAVVGLKLYLQEADRYFDIDVPDLGKVRTGGRIDRVDIYGPQGQERLRVVDYKSGTYKPAALSHDDGIETLMEKPDKGYIRQVLIYSHALMDSEDNSDHKSIPSLDIEPNLYFCSHTLLDAKTMILLKKQPITDYRTVQADFIKYLTDKVKEILTVTEFPPCEENKCKSYCQFLTICNRKVQLFE